MHTVLHILGNSTSMAGQLSTAVLECFLLELIPIIQREEHGSTEWLSKDVTIQLVKVCLGDMLRNVCEEVLELIDSDDRWMYHLTELRQYLWPKVESNHKLTNCHLQGNENINATRKNNAPFNVKQHKDLLQGL